MEAREAKLALARKKLKDHQVKKGNTKDGNNECPDNLMQDTKMHKSFESTDLSNADIKSDSEVQNDTHIDQNQNNNIFQSNPEVNLTELLVTSKRNLELKNNELQLKLSQLEYDYSDAVNNHNSSKQYIAKLEKNLRDLNDKFVIVADEVSTKDRTILNLNQEKSSLSDENCNLQDQLEFTKTVLTAKETENHSLHNQISKLQNQLDATQLHLQQITNGSADFIIPGSKTHDSQSNVALQQKISTLEQQLKVLQKERDQLTSHYEHYVSDLNTHLKSVSIKNEELTQEVQSLTAREISLIDQISDMEIRLQSYHTFKEAAENKGRTNEDFTELQQNYTKSMETVTELTKKYEDLQRQLSESEEKIKELSQVADSKCNHEEISITKLTADIASDKVAAQRATEQNRKLKTDVQDLEGAFIKLSRDKLELVEKLTAEKYLNRELTIKLAEIEEKAKDMHIKLKAKDEEMIRLLNNYRETEKQLEQLSEDLIVVRGTEAPENFNKIEQPKNVNHEYTADSTVVNNISVEKADLICDRAIISQMRQEPYDSSIPKEHAMLKLQERFLKIMEEVADLSDEKHRLEHIILQLQNETDTICEYVALYQQQRSMLKKRDEERSAQIKIFQTECDRLRKQLEELGTILLRFSVDSKLSTYFQDEAKLADMEKVMDLLDNLKRNTLVDPKKITLDLNNFYPCSCCSGQLIDV